ALAVWGAPARAAELASLEPQAGSTALEALHAAALAAVTPEGAYALNPPVLAKLVLDSLADEARVRLHRAALARPGLPPGQAFRHHRAAGEFELALAAADRALAISGDLQLADEAAALAASQGADVAAAWAERAGRLRVGRGRYREALPHLERAVALT